MQDRIKGLAERQNAVSSELQALKQEIGDQGIEDMLAVVQEQIDHYDQRLLAAKADYEQKRKELSAQRQELVAQWHTLNEIKVAGRLGAVILPESVQHTVGEGQNGQNAGTA